MDSYNVSHVIISNKDSFNHSRIVINNKDEPFIASETFVSTEASRILHSIFVLCLSFIVANIGIFSNIVVIVVFCKQGFSESMNVSMTVIAIWDLLKCIAGSISSSSGAISLFSGEYADIWEGLTKLRMNYFTCFASYVSSVLASYLATERCFCVILPFTVKTIFTPKVTFIAMVTISIVIFSLFAVVFGIHDTIWVFSPKWNMSIPTNIYNDFYHQHKGPLLQYYNLSGIIWPSISFVIIVVCTFVIVYQLYKSSKFRAGNSAGASSKSTMSTRDRQVVKMLLVIIAIYILNLFPRIALYVAKIFIYELYYFRKYHNLFSVFTYLANLLDLLNSAVNFFVFWAMSTNFRETTKKVFGFSKKK